MNNKIRQEINKIDIPKELSERSRYGVAKAKKEGRKTFSRIGIGVAAILFLSIGALYFLNQTTTPETVVVSEDGSLKLPAIQLPEESAEADMIGLIVYRGKIYTQSDSEIISADPKNLLGKRLGTSKGTIDEWSKQEEYTKEFASTIGTANVYSVKGYDESFRIMTYQERNGAVYAEFFENLNGITVRNGEDIFGKLKLAGNISSAQYQTFDEWDNNLDRFHPIVDISVLSPFIEELNRATPQPRTENSDPLGLDNYRNDENYRKLILSLKDGTQVSLTILKDGYIYYGFMGAYFKMPEDSFSKMWEQLQ